MKLTVRVIGPLAYKAGFAEKDLSLPGAATAGELLAAVGVADLPSIVTRNGKAVGPREALAEGDRVVISPIYSGG